MKKLFLFVFVFFMLFRFEVSADSYNYNQRGESVLSQSGYIAEKAVCGKDLGISELNSPNDIFISDEKVYIADSGNNRIICLDSELENVLEIYSSFKIITVLKQFCKILQGFLRIQKKYISLILIIQEYLYRILIVILFLK